MKLEGRWGESLGAYDHASLKLMELRKLWPDFRTGEVAQRLQKCRGGLKEVTQESARQQYAELSRDLEARIRKNPNDTEAYLSLGVLCQTYGDADGAIKAYKKVLSLQPGDGRAHYNLGIAYMTKRDLAHAAASLKKAADADPRSARAHHSLGVVYKDLGDYEGARRELEQAVAADPAFAPSYFALGQLYQSAFASREKAAAHWERYIHLKPDDPRAPAIREWIAQARLPEKAGYSAGQRDAGKESESRPPRWRTFFPFWRGVPGREGHGAEPTPVARNP
jgi:tetratricopeptide (TPR) repeat protein